MITTFETPLLEKKSVSKTEVVIPVANLWKVDNA